MLESYLKLAWKVLLRRKFFTFISLFGVAVTLAVLLVATAMLDQTFAPQAPEVRAGRTLGIYRLSMRGRDITWTGGPGYAFLDRYVRGMTTLPGVEKVAVYRDWETVASFVGGRKIESTMKRTDGEFWQILGFDFLEGGPITPADEANARFVAVINETTRERFFAGAKAVGRTIAAGGQRFRVIGVVRDVPILRFVPYAEIWVPISTAKSDAYERELIGDFAALILARDRADFPAIRADLAARLRQAEGRLPDPRRFSTLSGGADTLFEFAARQLWSDETGGTHPGRLRALLLGLMVLFMLLPTLNLVNVNLSRILERAPEIGVRKAFGASSWTLVGQFVVENVVLTLVGAGIGLALAAGALAAIEASGVIPYARFELNARVFLYGVAIAVFFGLFSGVYPAWRMSRLHPVEALRGRSS